MGQDRDKADAARQWSFVFAIARTLKTVEDKTMKNLVTHVPRQYDERTRDSQGVGGARQQDRLDLWHLHGFAS